MPGQPLNLQPVQINQYNLSMVRKPAGVIVSAILLILFSLFMLLGAFFSLVMAAAFKGNPDLVVSAPGAAAPSPGVVIAMMAFGALFHLALTVWGFSTSIGLFGMKNWARISIMMIGGLIAALGLFSAAICAILPTFMKTQALPPNVNPATLSAVFLVFAGICLVIMGIGIWWLIYFALRRTREAFAPPAAYVPASTMAYGRPLTDFTIAQPVETPAQPLETSATPLEAPPSATWAQTPPQPWSRPQAADQTPVAAPSKRPVSMLILGIFFMFGSAMSLAEMFSPFPIFFFGLLLSGIASHIVMFCYGVLLAYCGLGLIKLQRPAWLATFGLLGTGLLNTLAMLIPSYRERLIRYSTSMTNSMQAAIPSPANVSNPALNPHFLSMIMVPAAVFGVLVFVFLVAVLWRARWAFEPKTTIGAQQ
jgi:hypothetical protein